MQGYQEILPRLFKLKIIKFRGYIANLLEFSKFHSSLKTFRLNVPEK
jgi:hypothetical protein